MSSELGLGRAAEEALLLGFGGRRGGPIGAGIGERFDLAPFVGEDLLDPEGAIDVAADADALGGVELLRIGLLAGSTRSACTEVFVRTLPVARSTRSRSAI
jgi:hypothetical protein